MEDTSSKQLGEEPELIGESGVHLRGRGGIIDLAGEKLKQLQGRVFHAVVDNNRILQYRISQDGKLILEKTIKSLHLDSLKDKSSKLLKGAADVQLKSKWRKVVTGDPDKRIRDHMKEVPQVKFVDKLSFTLGVVVIVLSEWIALRVPSLFPPFYFLLMGVLLGWRYISYKMDKYQYFMLDFCYYVNMSVFLQYYLAPGNILWFKANYIFAMGPLCSAIIIWRNSLVFHSLDKVTSFFLHALPPMSLHLMRWNFIPEVYSSLSSSGSVVDFSVFDFFLFPIVFYLVWQCCYLFLTEHLLADRFKEDPELITALRYLASDRKSAMNKSLHNFAWKKGFLPKGEHLDPNTIQCKLIFVLIQFLFTLMTISYVPFLYFSYGFSCIYLALIFTWGTWNGASYYIEVFSRRYHLQFEETTSKTDVPVRLRADTMDSEAQTTDHEDDDDDEEYRQYGSDGVLTEDMAEEIYTALADLDSTSSASASSSTTSTTDAAPATAAAAAAAAQAEATAASSSGKLHDD